MVDFGGKFHDINYFHPLDRDPEPNQKAEEDDLGLSLSDVGMAHPFGVAGHNAHGVAAKIRTGVKKIELAFSGVDRAQGNQKTPGVYGKEQRQALREIAKSSGVEFGTHATVGVFGLSGRGQQGFSKAQQVQGLREINRAIEFASDVARGGNVVVHVGEFNRGVQSANWNKDGRWKDKFQMFEDEEKEEVMQIVNRETGEIQQVKRSKAIARPEWQMAKKGQEYIDFDGTKKVAQANDNIYTDYANKRVHRSERHPLYDPDKKDFEVKMQEWEYFDDEAKELTNEAREEWKRWKNGEMSQEEFNNSTWKRFLNNEYSSPSQIHIKPEEAYFIATLENQIATAEGWANYYKKDSDIKKLIEEKQTIEKQRETLKMIEERATSEEDKASLYEMDQMGRKIKKIDKMNSMISQIDNQINHLKTSVVGQMTQVKDYKNFIQNVENVEDYALKRSFDGYAQAGMKAMRQSEQLEKQGKLKKPIFVAMENIFPETYGAHPDEWIKLVDGARKTMANKLMKENKLSKNEAMKIAKKHIKGHLDTGHLNMWRKYWKGDPKKSVEENQKEFDEWLLEKTEEMAKNDRIGSVHLVDNFGYSDEHLSPGDGNTPVKEMIRRMKKQGFNGQMVIEPGADATIGGKDFHGLVKTWKNLGMNVGGLGRFSSDGITGPTWNNVHNAYHGRANPTYHVIGAYSPSEDWKFWSNVPLE